MGTTEVDTNNTAVHVVDPPMIGPLDENELNAALEATAALLPGGEWVLFNRNSYRLIEHGRIYDFDFPWPRYDAGKTATLFDLFDDGSHAGLRTAIERAGVTSLTRASAVTVQGSPVMVAISTFGSRYSEAVAVIDADAVIATKAARVGPTRTRLNCDADGNVVSSDGAIGSDTSVSASLGRWGERLVARSDRGTIDQLVAQVKEGAPYAEASVKGSAPGMRFRALVCRQPGSADAFVIDFFDETHEQEALQTLRRSQRRFDTMFEALPLGVFVAGIGGRLEFASKDLRDMFGAAASSSDFGWIDAVHPDDRAILEQATIALPNAHRTSSEIRMRKANGELGWFRVVLADRRDADGQLEAIVGFLEDISEQHELHRRIEYQANFDLLTGLPNRSSIVEHLRLEVEDHQTPDAITAVLFVDLDGFKLINDTQGHSVGDVVLVEVGRRLERAVGKEHFVGRFGGDEFLVISSNLRSTAEAHEIADAIHEALAPPILADGRIITIHASIGISLSGARATASEELIGDADIAMYEAKAAGRNRTVEFDAPLRTRAAARFDMTADLRHARRRHELRLDYQPILELATGTLTGVEALVRWNHPSMGEIGPSTFIPLAEEIGLVNDIGDFVVEQSVADLHQLREQAVVNDDFVISLNTSAMQFANVADFALTSLAALGQYGLPPKNLRFELTESVPINHLPDAARRISQLTYYGFGLAIDDFGTGYSSLGYLTMLPFDVLKLDLSLIAQIESSAAARAVVDSLVQMSNDMGFTIVAEGIETPAQRQLLADAGVHQGQGFELGRPVALRELVPVLAGQPEGSTGQSCLG